VVAEAAVAPPSSLVQVPARVPAPAWGAEAAAELQPAAAEGVAVVAEGVVAVAEVPPRRQEPPAAPYRRLRLPK